MATSENTVVTGSGFPTDFECAVLVRAERAADRKHAG